MPSEHRLTPLPKVKTVAQLQRDAYNRELQGPKKKSDQQLLLFDKFRGNMHPDYSPELEFFDTVPKFSLSAMSSTKKGQSVGIQVREFVYGDAKLTSTISPVVLQSRNAEGETIRKEIIPGPREETILRVLKKMAADNEVTRVSSNDGDVLLRFTLNQLRVRLKEVDRELKIFDIKESLEVLGRSALIVSDAAKKKQLFSGTYIKLGYATETDDLVGDRTLVEVGFNALAVAAINAEIYDKIHYKRLMSLSPLGGWIYGLLTRNFRQANSGAGYQISLSRILNESGMQAHQRLRSNVLAVRRAMKELTEKEVLASFPPVKEDVRYSSGGRGRRSISEVVWTIYPSESVVRDIRADNGDQMRRRERQMLQRG